MLANSRNSSTMANIRKPHSRYARPFMQAPSMGVLRNRDVSTYRTIRMEIPEMIADTRKMAGIKSDPHHPPPPPPRLQRTEHKPDIAVQPMGADNAGNGQRLEPLGVIGTRRCGDFIGP